MLPQQLNDWRFRGSLRPSSDISYIDFLNSELNFNFSSYFEKPFKLNNSKKHHWILRNLQPHLCYSLPIVCSVFPSCFQASTHFHIEIPSNRFYFCRCVVAFNAKVIYRFAVIFAKDILCIPWFPVHSEIGLLNRAAIGWAVSCSAFGLLNRAAVGWAVS